MVAPTARARRPVLSLERAIKSRYFFTRILVHHADSEGINVRSNRDGVINTLCPHTVTRPVVGKIMIKIFMVVDLPTIRTKGLQFRRIQSKTKHPEVP